MLAELTMSRAPSEVGWLAQLLKVAGLTSSRSSPSRAARLSASMLPTLEAAETSG
jgi:hypothetical protein